MGNCCAKEEEEQSHGDVSSQLQAALDHPDRWMTALAEMSEEFRRQPITKIALGGTHDAASYDFKGFKGLIVAPWTETQGQDFLGQLKSGARYFDLRPERVGGVFHFHHHDFTTAAVLINLLDALEAFYIHEEDATARKNEVVILDFTHFAGFDDDAFRTFTEGLVARPMLLKLFAPKQTEIFTLASLMDNATPIVVSYDSPTKEEVFDSVLVNTVANNNGRITSGYDIFVKDWNTGCGWWADVGDGVSELDKKLTASAEKGGAQDKLWVLQAMQTPGTGPLKEVLRLDLKEIPDAVKSLRTLKSLAEETQPWLIKVLNEQSIYAKNANIVITDYFNGDICKAIVRLNARRFSIE